MSIENKSRSKVSVKGQDKLTKHFPYNKTDEAGLYIADLKRQGYKPRLEVLDEAWLVRWTVNGKRVSKTVATRAEAEQTEASIAGEQARGLFIDYTKGHQVTFGSLLIKYLHEEAPKTKGFLITAYQINSWLGDAGLERQDVAAIHAAHPTPANRNLVIPRQAGHRMSEPSEHVDFIRKPFASLDPEDFDDFFKERLQEVSPATVDREYDLLTLVCKKAMEKWRIHVPIHPMKGVDRPKYFNERDRRLRANEEEKLLAAAREFDRNDSIEARVEELLAGEFAEQPTTKYRRMQLLKEVRAEAEACFVHVPMLETYIQFALMTGARKSEQLKLLWKHIDLEEMSAFLPETKNGRSRHLILRTDLIALLRKLPRTSERVFSIHKDRLRKAWKQICERAELPTEGPEQLRIHDLRHEAISRVAEAGQYIRGGFSLLDLQLFSGHRDTRMLLRYSHLLPKGLAVRLDAAFASKKKSTIHHGRRRLKPTSGLSMREIMTTPLALADGTSN